jgi:hypothetical protein
MKMKRLTTAVLAAVLTAVMGAANALADGGNTATNTIGAVQAGGLAAAASVAGPAAADASASATTGSAANTAGSSAGVAQIGGGNDTQRSLGSVQVANVHSRLGLKSRPAAGTVPVDVGGGRNSASHSIGAAQVGGGNSASGSAGAVQASNVQTAPSVRVANATFSAPVGTDGSGANEATGSAGVVQASGLAASPTATVGTTAVTAPVIVGGPGGNAARGSAGVVQLGGANNARGSTGVAQVGSGVAGGTEGSTAEPVRTTSSARVRSPKRGTAQSVNTRAPGDRAVLAKPAAAAKPPRIADVLGATAGGLGTLPFTGLDLAVAVVAGLLSAACGAGMTRLDRGFAR